MRHPESNTFQSVHQGIYSIPLHENFNHVSSESNNNITRKELENARIAWGNALVAISTRFDQQGLAAATQLAKQVLDSAYGYNMGPVLFKPTLTTGDHTFRTTYEGALSYFVGQNPNYMNDKGFAIMRSWRNVQNYTAAEFINGNTAMWMGIISITDKDGNVQNVDKSFGYKKDKDGNLRIVLHHSSVPYLPVVKVGTEE
jgi:hypothetical protein